MTTTNALLKLNLVRVNSILLLLLSAAAGNAQNSQATKNQTPKLDCSAPKTTFNLPSPRIAFNSVIKPNYATSYSFEHLLHPSLSLGSKSELVFGFVHQAARHLAPMAGIDGEISPQRNGLSVNFVFSLRH